MSWTAHQYSVILALVSGLLVSADLIMPRDNMIRINKSLRYKLRPFKNLTKTFLVSAMVAVAGTAVYLIPKFTVGSGINLGLRENVWLPIQIGGFIIGIVLQWLLVNALLLMHKPPEHFQDRSATYSSILNFRYDENHAKNIIQTQAISFSSLALIVIATIIFIKTVKSPYLMPLSLGVLTGVSALEISFGLTLFLRWFLTTDPNPDLGRNPRVLARIGILLFLIAGIIDLIH